MLQGSFESKIASYTHAHNPALPKLQSSWPSVTQIVIVKTILEISGARSALSKQESRTGKYDPVVSLIAVRRGSRDVGKVL